MHSVGTNCQGYSKVGRLLGKLVSVESSCHDYHSNSLQENGCEITVANEPLTVFGTLVVVSGDNPASSLMGGFKEGASAYRPCRQYFATLAETKQEVIFIVNKYKYNYALYLSVQRRCISAPYFG